MKNRAIIFTTILSATACFWLLPRAQAVVPPPDGGYPGFNTAEGQKALFSLTTGTGNVAVGWGSLYSDAEGSLNTAIGTGALLLNTADQNTATGAGALLFNNSGTDNTGNGAFALHTNATGSQNTASGVNALHNNDSDAAGLGNNNTAVGAGALLNNVDGSENTVVGTGSGQNLVAGFNNNYLGNFIGTCVDIGCSGPVPDESSTIRIGDLSENGFGSEACFIGGIFNNFQPLGGSVVEVTLDLNTDELGWDLGQNQSAPSIPSRSTPLRRSVPGAPTRPAMLNGKVGKVERFGSNSRAATETNRDSHSPAQRAVRANPEGERPARDEQASGQSGREQTLAVVHDNYRIIVCS